MHRLHPTDANEATEQAVRESAKRRRGHSREKRFARSSNRKASGFRSIQSARNSARLGRSTTITDNLHREMFWLRSMVRHRLNRAWNSLGCEICGSSDVDNRRLGNPKTLKSRIGGAGDYRPNGEHRTQKPRTKRKPTGSKCGIAAWGSFGILMGSWRLSGSERV